MAVGPREIHDTTKESEPPLSRFAGPESALVLEQMADTAVRHGSTKTSREVEMGWRYLVAGSVAVMLSLITEGPAIAAPDVVKVGLDHYRGKWLEIGRTPMFITDGCVAGYSTYQRDKSTGDIAVEDGCRVGTPKGRLKTVEGKGRIQDFGSTNAKMRVQYAFLITFDYWVLYKSPDKSWFISADPQMLNLWIYSRTIPSTASLRRMVRKASELGYDVRKLEFPAQ